MHPDLTQTPSAPLPWLGCPPCSTQESRHQLTALTVGSLLTALLTPLRRQVSKPSVVRYHLPQLLPWELFSVPPEPPSLAKGSRACGTASSRKSPRLP